MACNPICILFTDGYCFQCEHEQIEVCRETAFARVAGPFLWAVCSLQCCLWLHDLAGFCSLSISTSRKLPACQSVPASASANIRCENLRSGSRRGGKEMNGPTVGHSQSALYICRECFMTPRTMCVQRECVKCPDALRLMYHLRSLAEFESNLQLYSPVRPKSLGKNSDLLFLSPARNEAPMLSLPVSKTNKDSHMKLRKWFYLE